MEGAVVLQDADGGREAAVDYGMAEVAAQDT